MAMKSPVEAVCGITSCPNNGSGAQVLVCTSCGQCAQDSFHDDCDVRSTGMKQARVALCGNPDCTNSMNGRKVVVCGACGLCAADSFHDH